MPDDLYSTDSLAWAEHQANLLERLSHGERVNAEIDWPNVVEEVRDVGLSELRAARSLLSNAIQHLMKLHAWPRRRDPNHWRSEVMSFLSEATDACAPSMRQRIGLERLYRRARLLDAAARKLMASSTGIPPERCPYTLDDLLIADDTVPDIDRLVCLLTTND